MRRLTCLLLTLLSLPALAADKPNVLIILVDDMGFSDIGCYGGEIATPTIDALAENGLRFKQFYNAGRCCPTRASLLTGLYAHRAGIGHMTGDFRVPGYRGGINHQRITIAELLKPQGYFTAVAGKWHVGDGDGQTPRRRGFDRFFGFKKGGVYYDIATLGGRKLYLDDTLVADSDDDLPEGFYSTHTFTDYGIDFIHEAREQDKPFLLYLPYIAPHFPLQAPQPTIDKYLGTYRGGWDKLHTDRLKRQIELGLIDADWVAAPRPGSVRPWDKLDDAERERMDTIMAVYAAVIEEMDRSIGRVIETLREQGELDNTLILFMSDNGGTAEGGPMGIMEGGKRDGGPGSKVFCGMSWAWAQNTPFREFKRFVHEGGIATPMIIHWPEGVDSSLTGTWVDDPAHVIDILPTLADLTGADTGLSPTPLPGVSLRPALTGEPLLRESPLFWEHEGNRAVRDGDWKLVAARIGSPWELYNLATDRTESDNLAEAHPDIAARLAERWERWATENQVYPMPDRGHWRKPQQKQ